MTSQRLSFAMQRGGLVLPDTGPVAVIGARAADGLPLDPARCTVVTPFFPDLQAWDRQGVRSCPRLAGQYAAALVTLPRERERAQDWIARAEAACPGGLVVLDGAKTYGIDAIAKALRKAGVALEQVSKAHGKCLWFPAGQALSYWRRPEMAPNATGDMVAPGVFSADGPDPASQALAAALPDDLKGRAADLGAGWGWLSREILKRDKIKVLHLVEADHAALDCARINAANPRAEFHWADATTWAPDQPLDAVIMNPPFHRGRAAEPALGQGFIRNTARILTPQGRLFMVANRHLPYETTLSALFREVDEIGGDNRFKILVASRPSRLRR